MTTSNKNVALRGKQSDSRASRKEQRAARLLYQKVWERVGATYVDPSRLGDWNKWQNKFDSQIATTADAVKYIGQMLKSIGDEYTWLQKPDEVAESDARSAARNYGIGIEVQVLADRTYPIVETVLRGEPAAASGFRPGDEITFVDGVSTADMSLESTLALLLGDHGSHVRVRLVRNGRKLTQKSLRRLTCVEGSVEATLLPGRRIGVLKVTSFLQDDLHFQLRIAMSKLAMASALILDLRKNAGGTINYGIDLLTMLMRSGPVATFEDRCRGGAKEMQVVRINVDRIMTHMKRGKRSRSEWRTRQQYVLNDRPLVVLVDKDTCSTAELVAGTLKDNGFPVFGTRGTWGKAVGQEHIKLPGGYSLVVTGLRWYTPEGVWGGDMGQTLRIGVRPTHLVSPEKSDGEDVVLNEAVSHLKRELRRVRNSTARLAL